MREVLPGLFHWTTFHQPIDSPVSSYYADQAGEVIYPKEPQEGLEALPGTPRQVLLTSGHHHRDADRFAEAFDIPVRASREGGEYLGDHLDVDLYQDGEEVAPGITAIHVGELSADEGAFLLRSA